MTDRRRINGPSNGTAPPLFASSLDPARRGAPLTTGRSRKPREHRRIFLKTGLTPSASGSAYLETDNPTTLNPTTPTLFTASSSLKLTCTVHGPKPLPRSAGYSPNLLISTYVKFAPFAARQRRGYIRDSRERDLSVHLETALKGVVLGERWPKSGLDIIVTVLEGEDDNAQLNGEFGSGGGLSWGMMNVLAGCITVASAALADAGIDCLDLLSGGVAAIIPSRNENDSRQKSTTNGSKQLILDPRPSEHPKIIAACVVGYMATSDEITELWLKGDLPASPNQQGVAVGLDQLIDGAIEAASAARTVLIEAVKESAELQVKRLVPSSEASTTLPMGKSIMVTKDTKMEG